VFPDFTNPKIRSWWSRQYAYLLDVGKVKVLLSYTAMQVMVMKHPDWINSIC
jgi:ABC-type thiamine transport system substrate-binding protein